MVDATRLIDLADVRNGGRVEDASDDFFAPKERLILSDDPVFKPGLFTENGKWMDGWETRRRRTPGHDWCVVRLGFRGQIRSIDVDTRHFDGNQPSTASLEAADVPSGNPRESDWTEIHPAHVLSPNAHNRFEVSSASLWTHVRLNIYPDGGVARLRVFGTVYPDWQYIIGRGAEPIDLACLAHGGVPVVCSDEHFGRMVNLLRSDDPINMGDGWETRRRRGPGHDWVVIRLGTEGLIDRIEVYTTHFKGNYPDRCSVDGCNVLDDADLDEKAVWEDVISDLSLRPDAHHVQAELNARGPFTHLRLNIYPDGGIARFRAFGRPVL